jgi:hypothetical protein
MRGIRTNRRTRLVRRALLAIWILCSPFPLLAQDKTASLSGVLQDPTGVAIGGYASVTLDSAEDGLRRTIHPDEQGNFHFSGLTAGRYTLSTQVLGFDSLKLDLTLLAGEQRSWPPVRLGLGSSGCFAQHIDPVSIRFLSTGPAFGALAGNVNDGKQQVVNARVKLACYGGGECSDPGGARTDSQGNFEFNDVRLGRYILTIEHDGLLPLINIPFVVTGGLESSYTFTLPPCPNGDCRVKPPMFATDSSPGNITVCE